MESEYTVSIWTPKWSLPVPTVQFFVSFVYFSCPYFQQLPVCQEWLWQGGFSLETILIVFNSHKGLSSGRSCSWIFPQNSLGLENIFERNCHLWQQCMKIPWSPLAFQPTTKPLNAPKRKRREGRGGKEAEKWSGLLIRWRRPRAGHKLLRSILLSPWAECRARQFPSF